MTISERGLYHSALNYSWTNDGLPVSADEICRVLRVPPKDFMKAWPRVALCFTGSDRLRNNRQEEERSNAKEKSCKASDAVRQRELNRSSVDRPIIVRSSNDHPRAYGSVSVSEFSEVLKKEKGFDFELRFTAAWNRHRKHRGTETMQIVAQLLLDIDWDIFDASHVGFCAFWDRNDWTKCPVTMLEWFRNGMPVAPPEPETRPSGRKSTTEEILEELRKPQ